MKNPMKKTALAVLIAAGSQVTGLAQEVDTQGYNPLSVRPVHQSHVMFKRTVWRQMDLKEKQNWPFMARENEITKFMFEAVKAGLLTAYTNDSVNVKLGVDEFIKNTSVSGTSLTPDELASEKQRINDDSFLSKEEKQQQLQALEAGSAGQELPPSSFALLELKEDLIFDKQRSRAYWDIQTITVLLPGYNNEAGGGVDKPVASFRFKDLARLFKSNPKAIWFNGENNAEHRNLADAFELRLFSGRIIKVSNPKNEYLFQTYEGDRQGLIASQRIEQELMEFEHNLWEF